MTQVVATRASERKGAVIVDAERCKGCGLCVSACKRGVLRICDRLNTKGYCPVEVVQPDKCTGCSLCALMCPDIALKTYRRKAASKLPEKAGS